MKRLTALLLTVIMIISMTGCGNNADTPDDSEQNEAVKVGLILGTGGLGNKNFNDMSYAGVTRAQEELGIEFDYVEPSSISDFLSFGRQFAETEEYDLILAIGSDQEEAMTELIEEFPDQKIALIGGTSEIEGISTIQTEWTEQIFLAGVIAGLGTLSDLEYANEQNVIGVILGMDLPNLRKGVVGFTAGAKYVNPDVEVLEGVVGAFNDPGKGKEIALSMYNKGADFIQCIAGASGLGVFSAAAEANGYAFGVGTNQNTEDPDHVVASSYRSVENMVYGEIEKVVNGTWESGLILSGIQEGAVGCTTEGSNVELPADIQAAYEETGKR